VGGSTLARQLLEKGIDTLVLEEGPYIPADNVPSSYSEQIRTMWRNGGLTAAMGKPMIPYAEARCVGGGSEINSAIIQRCPDALLDEWASTYQIEGFSADKLKPYYEQSEELIHAQYPSEFETDSLVLKRAGEALSWKAIPLKMARNASTKFSMTRTLLPQSLMKGLRLVPYCKAEKLIVKNNEVKGIKAVVTSADGQKKTVSIKAKYYFCCSGAINTPALLLKSGISQNVGQSLKMHPTIKVLAKFQEEINATPSAVPGYAITEFMPDIRIGGAVFNPSFFGMYLAADFENRAGLLNEMSSCGIYYAMIRPEGMGSIKMLPGIKEPMVKFNLNKTDRSNLVKGLNYLKQAMFAAGAELVIPSIKGHKGWLDNSINLDSLPQDKTELMTIHLFSSCPMGENKKLCAADSYGKVHGFDNLFISDASLIPGASGVNPQGSIMAITLRNAEHFLSTANF
jgi:choline dehydrogenase-like flavoprotein